MVGEAQGEIDHLKGPGRSLGLACETRQPMAQVRVAGLDRKSQIFTDKVPILGQNLGKPCPAIGQKPGGRRLYLGD